MRRESYLSQPSAVEVYPVFAGTDVIMRKNIELVDKEDIQDGKKNKYKVWECEEVQFHYQGKVTQEEIEADLDVIEYACRRYADCDDDEIAISSEGGVAYADTSAARKTN